MARVANVEIQGLFEVLDASCNTEDSAFTVASPLLNMDINAVFSFVDCPPRRQLRETLSEYLKACPHVTCTHENEVSFLSHASTSLWWWLFTKVKCETTRCTMAYMCEVSVRYPCLEQLALWAAFVRSVGEWQPVPRSGASESNGEKDEPCVGKLVGISGSSMPIMEHISDDDVCSAHTQFRGDEILMRAHYYLGRPDMYSYFTQLPKNIQQQAILERLLLRGDWKNADVVNTVHFILYASSITEDKCCVAQQTLPQTDMYHGFHETVVRVVDSTASMTVLEANAVLTHLHVPRIVESLVERFGNRVLWV